MNTYVSRHCEARSNPEKRVIKKQIDKMIVKNNYIKENNGKFSASNSGLPRRSYLTARNDDVPFCELCGRKNKPQRTQRIFAKNAKKKSCESYKS